MTEVKIPDVGGVTMNMIDVGGFISPSTFKPPDEIQRIFDSVPHYQFRHDDLMLCTFPKTGTNWMYELLMMTLKSSANRVRSMKTQLMLEMFTADEIGYLPSPRVINCHYPPRYLPIKDMKAKQIKTVLCCRNPKDTAVSYYNHMKGIKRYDYSGKLADWLPVYLQGKLEYGKYTDYLLEWERIIQDSPGFPLHIVYFEDLKLHGSREMNKLLKFLGVQLHEDLVSEILDMCSFNKMAKEKFPKHIDIFFQQDFQFFRKGLVGDWRNWFTVAQNNMFDNLWNTEMKDSKVFKFTYSDVVANL